MSNVADSAEATSNGQVVSLLGGAAALPPADILLDDELDLDPEASGVVARGYWEGVWLRLKRDRLAVAEIGKLRQQSRATE